LGFLFTVLATHSWRAESDCARHQAIVRPLTPSQSTPIRRWASLKRVMWTASRWLIESSAIEW